MPAALHQMQSLLEDVLYGAVSPGVNLSTKLIMHVVLGLCVLSLVSLLAVSVLINPIWSVHAVVLLVLAVALWISMTWLIDTVGLTDSREQKKLILGEDGNFNGSVVNLKGKLL